MSKCAPAAAELAGCVIDIQLRAQCSLEDTVYAWFDDPRTELDMMLVNVDQPDLKRKISNRFTMYAGTIGFRVISNFDTKACPLS